MAVVAVAVTVAGSELDDVALLEDPALLDGPVSLGAPDELEDPDELDTEEAAEVWCWVAGWVDVFPFAPASGSTYC